VPGNFRMLLFVGSKSTAVAAAALVALSWGAAGGLASADPPAPAPTPPPGPAPAPPPGPGPKTTIDHNGTFAVGTDIAPGTYTSAGPVGNGTCYWKRLAGDDGKQLVDNAMSKKPQVVRIDPTDKAFKTDGCQPWQKNDEATPDQGKSPADAGLPLGILGSLLGGGPPPPPPAAPAPPKP
jgi:hypothetical protein